MALTLDIAALEGASRLEAYRKAHEDGTTVRKAMVPAVNRWSYDQVMRAFEADSKSFTDDAVDYLSKSPSTSMRVLEFVGSTERRDRDGDRILVAGWDTKEWKRNPAFPWAHDYGGLPKAVGLKAWKDTSGDTKALKFLELFPEGLESEDAQRMVDMIFALYSSSPPMLKAVSVGFLPTSLEFAEDDEEREKMDLGMWGALVKKAELWELSGCLIGSNYDALLSTAKKTAGSGAIKILDAMGFEIPTGKSTFPIPEFMKGTPGPDPEPAPAKTPEVIIPLAAITGEDPEAREALKSALEDRVLIGQNAKNLLDTLFPKTQEDDPQEPETEPTEPDSGEPSDAESDEDPPDEIPDGAGEDVYGDGDLLDDMASDEPEETTPPADEESGDLIDDFAAVED